MRQWSLRTLFLVFTVLCVVFGRAMFVWNRVNACEQFCTDIAFTQQEPSVASSTFTVVVPRKLGEQAIQLRKRNKIVYETQRRPLFAFLTGDHIEAVTIPAAAVNAQSTSALSKMKSLQHVVVIGDTPQFNAIARLREELNTVQVSDNEEILEEKIFKPKVGLTASGEGPDVK